MPDQVTEQVELGFELAYPTLRTVLIFPQLWRMPVQNPSPPESQPNYIQ